MSCEYLSTIARECQPKLRRLSAESTSVRRPSVSRFTLVPSAVIKGMLAAIGITIVWKQLPVAFGASGGILSIPTDFHPGVAAIAIVSLAILYGWKYTPFARTEIIVGAYVLFTDPFRRPSATKMITLR